MGMCVVSVVVCKVWAGVGGCSWVCVGVCLGVARVCAREWAEGGCSGVHGLMHVCGMNFQ